METGNYLTTPWDEAMGDRDEEQDWVARARQGDREAFAALVRAHYDRIYRLCFRWTGQKEDAEDAAQEVCLKLARAMVGFRGQAAFATWVYGIGLNTLRDLHAARLRQATHQAEELDPEVHADPGHHPEQSLFARQIRRCIRLLPETLRAAILLVHGEGLTHRQAGEALACAEGTVSWRLSEARKRLALCLDHGG